jgi:hypothetical protein
VLANNSITIYKVYLKDRKLQLTKKLMKWIIKNIIRTNTIKEARGLKGSSGKGHKREE